MYKTIAGELLNLTKAVLIGAGAALGASFGGLALIGILDLCCTDGGLRAAIELPAMLVESLRCAG